ncbi:hypothetical protein ANO11243_097250 [Dothideomycetidae sp. 11243]|nr:hypothetical protein ANO11243_097250 [fungal sp. No.11243]
MEPRPGDDLALRVLSEVAYLRKQEEEHGALSPASRPHDLCHQRETSPAASILSEARTLIGTPSDTGEFAIFEDLIGSDSDADDKENSGSSTRRPHPRPYSLLDLQPARQARQRPARGGLGHSGATNQVSCVEVDIRGVKDGGMEIKLGHNFGEKAGDMRLRVEIIARLTRRG